MKDSALMYRSLHEQPYLVDSGRGSYFKLQDGREILDACGGAGVACIGHGNEEVRAAIIAQLDKISYIFALSLTTQSAEDLARCILEVPPGGFQHGLENAYFCGSGSEATDAAMKFCRQYFFEKGEPQRKYFISRRQGYHGATVGSMSVSSNLSRRVPYQDIMLPNTAFVSPAYAYQYQMLTETEGQYVGRLIHELEAKFQQLGPQNIVSFIAEPVGGAATGCVPAPKGYFSQVRELCDKYGILLHLDEVMCGMGRTGTYFAFEQEGIRPDIVTIGKGLGGGYAPIAGILVSKKCMDVVRQGTGVVNHLHTFQNHPATCAAALAVQKVIKRDGLTARVCRMGLLLQRLLVEEFADRKYVGDIRGKGFFWGIEFVADKISKDSLPQNLSFGRRVVKSAFDLGVAVYPGAGTVDGLRGDNVLLAPPYNISDTDLRKSVRLLREAYDIEERRLGSSAIVASRL